LQNCKAFIWKRFEDIGTMRAIPARHPRRFCFSGASMHQFLVPGAGVCSVIDIVLVDPTQYHGFVARGETGHQRASAGE
jgi:hypothetical protein